MKTSVKISMMIQESGVIPRIMSTWRARRDKDYGGKAEAFPLGFENLLFPVNLLASSLRSRFCTFWDSLPILTRSEFKSEWL